MVPRTLFLVAIVLAATAVPLAALPGPPYLPIQAPDWTAGGENPSWHYGVALEGPADPEVAYATDLIGNYNSNECSWIVSPPVHVPQDDATLRFDAWSNVLALMGKAWDLWALQVSTDDGASWTLLDVSAATYPLTWGWQEGSRSECRTSLEIPSDALVLSGDQTAWTTITGDLSAYANEEIRLRFVMGSDMVIQREGVYLKDLWVGPEQLLR